MLQKRPRTAHRVSAVFCYILLFYRDNSAAFKNSFKQL